MAWILRISSHHVLIGLFTALWLMLGGPLILVPAKYVAGIIDNSISSQHKYILILVSGICIGSLCLFPEWLMQAHYSYIALSTCPTCLQIFNQLTQGNPFHGNDKVHLQAIKELARMHGLDEQIVQSIIHNLGNCNSLMFSYRRANRSISWGIFPPHSDG